MCAVFSPGEQRSFQGIRDIAQSATVVSHFATFQKYWCLLQLVGETINSKGLVGDDSEDQIKLFNWLSFHNMFKTYPETLAIVKYSL